MGTTFTSLDKIDGGAGTADTLNVAAAAAFTNPVGATVTNVEVINYSLAATGNTVNTTAFTGLTNLNATAVGVNTLTAASTTAVALTGATIGGTDTVLGGSSVSVTATGLVATDAITVGSATAAPTGAVTISATGAFTGGTAAGIMTVTGGSTVGVTEAITNSALTTTTTSGAVAVTGTAITTSVSVAQAAVVGVVTAIGNVANTGTVVAAKGGVATGAVTIADANAADSTTATAATLAGTITSVTLANYGVTTISSAALNTLTLSGTGTSVTTLEAGSTAATNKTLTLNLGGGTQTLIADSSAQFATINANVTAATTVTTLTDTALRTMNVAGSGVLTLTNMNTAVTALAVTGAAGLNTNLSGTAGLTSFTAANTTGAITLTLNAATQAFTGGTGTDVISIAADATKVITGGSGTADQLVLTGASAGYTAANTGAKVSGFEQLVVNNAGATTAYDMTTFTANTAAAFNKVIVKAGASTTFTKVVAGTALQIEAATGTLVSYNTADTAGATDTVAVTLKGATVTAANGGGTSGYATTALTLADANAVGLGTVTINSDASTFQGLHTIATLTDTALSNLTITGTGSLGIGLAATTSTTLTIADNGTGTSATADGFTTSLTSTGNVLGSINYSGTHNFTTVLLVDNVANATVTNANTGTTGVFTIGGWTDANMVGLTLNGSVALTGVFAANAAASFLGSTDNSAVSITAVGGGIKTVTLGNGANTVITGAAADKITLGTGANSVTAGAGADTIVFGTHTGVDTVVQAAAANSGAFAAPGTNTISTTAFDVVTGLKAGDKISLAAFVGAIAHANDGLAAVDAVAANTLVGVAATDNNEIFVRGTFDSVGKTFVGSATGVDTLVVYDGDITNAGQAQEAIVLVGYVALTVAGINAAAGLITLG